MKRVIVSGAFDDMRFGDFRFLNEAAQLGAVHALLWSDEAQQAATGKPPRFPQAEREYFLQSIRYVSSIALLSGGNDPDALPAIEGPKPGIWAVSESSDTPGKQSWCDAHGLEYRVLSNALLKEAPPPPACPDNPPGKKVVVTGCFDWFHSGHVRFFEECAELGDLYVCVGNDATIRQLKGEGHPLFPAEQRCHIAGSIRFVKQALISTGMGWLDAEPEFLCLKPDIFAVNEDGDRPEKRALCERLGIQYRVLRRLPKPGLPRRQSTVLRGF